MLLSHLMARSFQGSMSKALNALQMIRAAPNLPANEGAQQMLFTYTLLLLKLTTLDRKRKKETELKGVTLAIHTLFLHSIPFSFLNSKGGGGQAMQEVNIPCHFATSDSFQDGTVLQKVALKALILNL